MSGRFVYECDGIDEDLMTKFEREANQVMWFVRRRVGLAMYENLQIQAKGIMISK